MMRQVTIAFATAMLLWTGPARAAGPSSRYDQVVHRMLDEYFKIHRSLAADSTRDVAQAAHAIEKLAAELQAVPVKNVERAAEYRSIPPKVRLAAQQLARAQRLAAARESMKELSRPLVLWATLAQPKDINVLFCSMAKASWLQRDAKISNPYYGSQMLRCGEVVSGPAKGQTGGHMKKGT